MLKPSVLALWVLFLAYLLWLPGISLPVLSLHGEIDKAELAQLGKQLVLEQPGMAPMIRGMVSALVDNLELSGSIAVYDKSNSILGVVSDLWRSGNALVAMLVVLFSVVIPVFKALLVFFALLGRSLRWRGEALSLANIMSKWSMADVFVVAILVAYLAAMASGEGNLLRMQAQLGSGFYFFAGYCVLSVVSAQLMQRRRAPSADTLH